MQNKFTFILLAIIFIVGGLYFASTDRSINKPVKELDTSVEIEDSAITKETIVFFGNIALNPNTIDCNKVFSVKRRIKDKPNFEELTIEKLLAGPNELEKLHGYYSSLKDVGFISLKIVGDVATIDFENLPSGGSCLVTQARAQIESTLKQFENINEVLITEKGDSVDVLQP